MARINKAVVQDPLVNTLRESWCWLFGLGVLFLILGCIGLVKVIGFTLVSMYFFGFLLILSGLSHLVDVFKNRHWKGIIGQSLISVLYVAGGFTVLYDPFLASTLITGLLGAVLIVIGTTRIIMTFALKDTKEWVWLLLAGITALILGCLILAQWPLSGLWIIGLFVAIEMIVNGWTYLFIALSLRTALKSTK